MRLFYVIYFFLSTFFVIQNKDQFKVVEISKKMDNRGNEFFQQPHYSNYFFEDENYIVNSECQGEFGGKIYFKDKKNGKINFCASTCSVIINKIDKSYYLTTSLRHGTGSYGLYEITNPKELTEKENDTINYSRYDELIGLKPLSMDWNKTILLSFVYKSRLYHIVSGNDETYLAERINSKLNKIQTLINREIYSIGNETRKTKDNHYLAIFYSQGKQGFIDVYENDIKITTYE